MTHPILARGERIALYLALWTIAGGLLAAAPGSRPKILNDNSAMEYRRLGKTGLMVSAVGLGGHWKRVGVQLGGSVER